MKLAASNARHIHSLLLMEQERILNIDPLSGKYRYPGMADLTLQPDSLLLAFLPLSQNPTVYMRPS